MGNLCAYFAVNLKLLKEILSLKKKQKSHGPAQLGALKGCPTSPGIRSQRTAARPHVTALLTARLFSASGPSRPRLPFCSLVATSPFLLLAFVPLVL